MVWITKTEFVGSAGNKTTEINESTDKEWAEVNKQRQIERWYRIVVDSKNDIPSQLLYPMFTSMDNIRLDMIHFVIDMTNKYANKEYKSSFSKSNIG